MTVVTFGVWDLLHVWHVRFLTMASGASHLIVGVQDDDAAEKQKGVRPTISVNHRLTMVRSVYCVRAAFSYGEELVTSLERMQPEHLAVGSDWGERPHHHEAIAWCNAHSVNIVTIPRTEGISTTLIRERIRES